MKKILLLSLVLAITLTSCGRKGALEYSPGQTKKSPKFDKISDEIPTKQK